MPEVGSTALVLLTPELDPLLTRVRARCPSAVRAGIPAHLTLLHPFVPEAVLDDRARRRCAEIMRARPRMGVRFDACEVRPGFVSVVPRPVAPLMDLIAEIRAAWPDVEPYGGRYPAHPHVTLGLHVPAPDEQDVVEIVMRALPLDVAWSEGLLVVVTGSGWAVRDRFPLGAGTPTQLPGS